MFASLDDVGASVLDLVEELFTLAYGSVTDLFT